MRFRMASKCVLALAIVAVLLGACAFAEDLKERPDLDAVFREQGVTSTFVLYDVPADRLTIVNRARAETRFVPASTFKIANSLIALETGVVKDESEIIPYGGKPQPIKVWEKDMSMREAIKVSNVPIYQEIARRVGTERYRLWLDRLDYGNRQTGSAVETFWLDGPLAISAVEQAKFIALLAQQRLPMSMRSQSIVRDILLVESRDGFVLYGKTGWQVSRNPQLG
jgi:beta-lactamase class D